MVVGAQGRYLPRNSGVTAGPHRARSPVAASVWLYKDASKTATVSVECLAVRMATDTGCVGEGRDSDLQTLCGRC